MGRERETWGTTFTAELRYLKDTGCDFDTAWSRAVQLYPLDVHAIGGPRPSLAVTLLDDADEVGQAAATVRWYREVCAAAWHDAPARDGSPSRLGALPSLNLMIRDVDFSTSARRMAHRGMAA